MTFFIQNIFRTIIDCVFKHLHRSGVECRIYATPFAHRHFHFWYCRQSFIQHFDILKVFFNARMWHAGWHQQIRTFVERRHKLLTCSRESLCRSLPTYFFETRCDWSKYLIETLPRQQTKK